MYSIVGIVFCLLVGILLAHFGWIALLWTPMGFIVGLYLSANMILPITLGVPMAFSYTVKKQIRPRVFWAILRTPLFWFILLFLFGWFVPSAVDWISKNETLNIGMTFGFIVILLSPISKKARNDFKSDFDKSYGHYYINPNEGKPKTNVVSVEGQKWLKGYEAYQNGNLYLQKEQWQEALVLYDEAIKCGFEDDVFCQRGICLQSLDFHLDAIEDFNKAIDFDPEDCNIYFLRSFSKDEVGDIEGCISDREDAVRLSVLDTELNRNYRKINKDFNSTYNFYLQFAKGTLEQEIKDNDRYNSYSDDVKKIIGKSLLQKRKERVHKRRSDISL